MRLSPLQRFILLAVLAGKKQGEPRDAIRRGSGGRVDREVFFQYYTHVPKAPSRLLQTKIITQSLLRLIERGFLIGYGYRTEEKWFLQSVALTLLGRKQAKGLQGEQQVLPLRRQKKHG